MNKLYIAAMYEQKIEVLEKKLEVMKQALKKSCICGEFGFIFDLCPACVALEECEKIK